MKKDQPHYAQIVFPIPLERTFDYAVPPLLRRKVDVGIRVRAPFGRVQKIGYLVGLSKKSHLPSTAIKAIEALLDEEPFLDKRLLELSKRISQYYLCSWGEALEAIFPASLRPRKRGSPPRAPFERSPEAVAPLEREYAFALEAVTKALTQKPKVFLLWSEPGSAKIELILQAVQGCLEKGLSSIVLYPEIALTRGPAERFRSRFGNEVCVLHSRVSPLDRYAIWKDLKEGNYRVVVGVRSAIFSPVQRLGLIVCCEEHDASYKQEESPRYHARQVALMRSELEGASVLLESETPSLESYTAALEKRYALLKLPRISPSELPPKVSVVDMREELHHQKKKVLFSKYLERRMAGVLKEKGQVLLFLNRRGFSTFVHCRRCGMVIRCTTCGVPLKYHSQPKRLICHYCNTQEIPPNICPSCRESHLHYTGTGTERIESEVHRLFPDARIARMDRDVVKEETSEMHLAEAFRRGELDILIGTQMVVREGVFEKLSLVGILSADILLNTPHFRSGEETFAMFRRLMRQVRGGKEGELIIQSYSPQHPVLLACTSPEESAFYEQEMRSRKELGFPPFQSLVQFIFRGKSAEKVLATSKSFKKRINHFKKRGGISILGPAPTLPPRVKGEYQWQLLAKFKKGNASDFLKEAVKRFQKSRSVKVIVDVDPY